MKRLALAIALACALSGSALAGDAHTVGAPEPTPGETHTPPGETQAPPEGESTQATELALLFLDLVF